jgi:hypothetical protein
LIRFAEQPNIVDLCSILIVLMGVVDLTSLPCRGCRRRRRTKTRLVVPLGVVTVLYSTFLLEENDGGSDGRKNGNASPAVVVVLFFFFIADDDVQVDGDDIIVDDDYDYDGRQKFFFCFVSTSNPKSIKPLRVGNFLVRSEQN